MTLQLLSLTLLCGLLMAACVRDVHARRIPNTLVLYGMGLGLCMQVLAAGGAGLFARTEPGLAEALVGGLTGLLLLLPLYVLRTMGAGDVKLMAMVGVWLGPQAIVQAVLWSLAAGGALALGMALASGALRQVGHNLARIVSAAVVRSCSGGMITSAPVQTTGRMPYALAITAGTAVELALRLPS